MSWPLTRRLATLVAASARLPTLWPALGLMSASASLVAYAVLPPEPVHAAQDTALRVLGQPLREAADPAREAHTLARRYLRETLTVHVGPWEFATTRAAAGVEVDQEAFERLLRDAHDARSVMRRFHDQAARDAALEVPIPARLDPLQSLAWARRIRDQVQKREVSARMDTTSWKPVSEQPGLAVDVHGTLDALAAALLRGARTLAAKVQPIAAARTLRELENHDFSQLIGAFETRFNTQDKDRSFNLRVAARHIDGLVLLPGEVFDFNAIVGERSEANGFRPAPVIAGGELTDGVGGGTCQIAGTLYAAVYFAGLNVLERSTHTRPSAYLKLGLDATVSYPKLNLRFQNDLEHALAISARVENGRVRVALRSTRLDREVRFVRRIDAITPYGEASRDDPALPSGARVLSQRGVPGFEVTSFRLIRERATNRIVRERRHEQYPPTQQIWRVGRGPVGTSEKLPPHDRHGEYVADEYVVLSYTTGRPGPEEEKRVEGRSGTLGWTAREGMPQPAL